MSEKYRLIKHNKNLAEIGINEGLGLLFLVDEDYERKLRIIVGCLNEKQATIDKLDQENADLLGARIKAQEEWEKCTDKLKAKILEQQSIIEAKDKEIEESKITIQLYEADVSMRDNFLKSKGLYDEFLQCILE